MAYGSEEDLVREYEMIGTLFNATEDQEEDDKNCACGPQEGIVSRVFKFLFGNHSEPDDCESYEEKRPFHRHVYQPSQRAKEGADSAAKEDNLGPTDTTPRDQHWRLRAESAVMTREPLDMAGPGEGFPQSPFFPQQHRFLFSDNLLRVIAAVTLGAAFLLISSASDALNAIKSYLRL